MTKSIPLKKIPLGAFGFYTLICRLDDLDANFEVWDRGICLRRFWTDEIEVPLEFARTRFRPANPAK